MSIFTEPKDGLAFTVEKLTPAQFNTIVDSERSIFRTLVATKREVTLDAGIIGSTTGLNCYWSQRAQCWIYRYGTRMLAFTCDGVPIDTGAATPFSSAYGPLLSNEVADGTQIEAYPTAVSTPALYSTDFGATWSTLIAYAALGGYVAGNQRSLFLGGPDVARLVPVHNGPTGTTLAMLAVTSTNTAAIVPLPSPTIGPSDFVPRLAHNGSGHVVMVGCYSANAWSASSYGLVAGSWSVSTLPTGSVTYPASIDYDDESGLFIVLRRNTTTATGESIRVTTSTDGVTWSAWRTLPFEWRNQNSALSPEIRCIGGIWFIINWEWEGDIGTGLGTFELWYSHDHGASWVRACEVGVARYLSTAADLDVVAETTADGRLAIVTGFNAGSHIATATTFGPFITPVALAST